MKNKLISVIDISSLPNSSKGRLDISGVLRSIFFTGIPLKSDEIVEKLAVLKLIKFIAKKDYVEVIGLKFSIASLEEKVALLKNARHNLESEVNKMKTSIDVKEAETYAYQELEIVKKIVEFELIHELSKDYDQRKKLLLAVENLIKNLTIIIEAQSTKLESLLGFCKASDNYYAKLTNLGRMVVNSSRLSKIFSNISFLLDKTAR